MNGLWGKTQFYVTEFMVDKPKTFQNLLEAVHDANRKTVSIRGFQNSFQNSQYRNPIRIQNPTSYEDRNKEIEGRGKTTNKEAKTSQIENKNWRNQSNNRTL